MGWSIYRLTGPCMDGLDLRTGRTVGRFFWVTGLARWEICRHWIDTFFFFIRRLREALNVAGDQISDPPLNSPVINPQALTTQHLALTNNQLNSAYNQGSMSGELLLHPSPSLSQNSPSRHTFRCCGWGSLPSSLPTWWWFRLGGGSDLVVVNHSNLEYQIARSLAHAAAPLPAAPPPAALFLRLLLLLKLLLLL